MLKPLKSELSNNQNLNKVIANNIKIVLHYLENHSVADLYRDLFSDVPAPPPITQKYFSDVIYRAKKRHLTTQNEIALDIDRQRLDNINHLMDQKIDDLEQKTQKIFDNLETRIENQFKRAKQAHTEDFLEKMIDSTSEVKKSLYDDFTRFYDGLNNDLKNQLALYQKTIIPVNQDKNSHKPLIITGFIAFFSAVIFCCVVYVFLLKPNLQQDMTQKVLVAIDKTLAQPDYKTVRDKFLHDLNKHWDGGY